MSHHRVHLGLFAVLAAATIGVAASSSQATAPVPVQVGPVEIVTPADRPAVRRVRPTTDGPVRIKVLAHTATDKTTTPEAPRRIIRRQ